jgi:hypothetical protein
MRQELRQLPSCQSIVEGSTSKKGSSASSASIPSPVQISVNALPGPAASAPAQPLRFALFFGRQLGVRLNLPHNHSLHWTRPRRRATDTLVGRASELRIR